MSLQSIDFKRGDTLSLSCARKDSLGAAVNLTGVTITSSVKVGAFTDTLTVTVTDAVNGLFTLTRAAASTALWPVSSDASVMYCDVQFVGGGVTRSSETFIINVVEDITT